MTQVPKIIRHGLSAYRPAQAGIVCGAKRIRSIYLPSPTERPPGLSTRSIRSLDTQILAGLDKVDTKWVGIAEHDCVYPREHIEYIPSDEAYHYNSNLWYARCCDGSYSYHGPVLSQLVASKESLRRAMTLRLTILSDPKWSRHYPNRMGEPGLANRQKVRWLADRIRVNGPLRKAIEEYLSLTSVLFCTKVPCLDIRHASNWTGDRRGRGKTLNLPPWGKLSEVLCN